VTECRRCGAKAANAFLCRRCVEKLTNGLREMPWLLNRLTETAIGQTRMSDNGGRKSARRKDLDGDAELAACIETLPPNKADDLAQARREREQHALAHALASGRINAKASELLSEISDGLGFWVRVLCEQRGIRFRPHDFIGPLLASEQRTPEVSMTLGAPLAAWLAVHVDAIALSEEADDIATDVERWAEDITRVINRPVRYWPLGQCPAETADGPCESELPRVPEHTENVVCQECKTRHSVARVLVIRKHEREGVPQKRRELVRYNGDLPPEFQIPPRTLRHWLANGTLTPCGWDGEDPLYSWMDVRLLMLDRRASRPADNQAG
jgi:hypothetical protein